MAIEIELGECLSTFPRVREILSIKALKADQLPKEYLSSGHRCWMSDGGWQLTIVFPSGRTASIQINSKVWESAIPRLKEDLARCGRNLLKVKQELHEAEIAKEFKKSNLPKSESSVTNSEKQSKPKTIIIKI